MTHEKVGSAIIFLDYEMPKLDGEQFIKVLKRRGDDIPIIIMSGCLMSSDIEKMLSLGVKGFLSKPMQFRRFCAEVKKVYPIEISEV